MPRSIIFSVTLFLLAQNIGFTQSIKKVIHVTVRDETGKVIPGAAVQYKGLLNTKTKYTDQAGTTQFEITLLTSALTSTIDISAANFDNLRKEVRLIDKQDSYDISVNLQSKKVKILVEVIDGKNQLPIGNASVQLQTTNGQTMVNFTPTDYKGETVYYLKHNEVVNAPMRFVASANGYEEKWSDVANSLVTSNENVYTIYLKNNGGEKDEKVYGPYIVTPGKWTNTALLFSTNQSFRVKATGIIRYKEHPFTPNTPDGGGYWGWWQLKGKIGEDLFPLGSSGKATNKSADMVTLELGAPATVKMGHPEESQLEGYYSVYVYSKDEPDIVHNIKQPTEEDKKAEEQKKYRDAEQHLEFLQKAREGKVIAGRSAGEIVSEIKFIVLRYELIPLYYQAGTSNDEDAVDRMEEERAKTMKYHLEALKKYFNWLYQPPPKPAWDPENDRYHNWNSILRDYIATLQERINEKKLY